MTETAILDLPPAPPAYVEVDEHFVIPQAWEFRELLTALGGDHEPPHVPHEHVDEGTGEPLRVNVSDTLSLEDHLAIELIPANGVA